jgi:hypothetical protein
MDTQQILQEITPTGIIMGDHTCQNGEGERVLSVIKDSIRQGNSLLVRKYNSLYFITRLDNADVEGHFYSVDNAFKAVKAVKYFIEQTKESGAKKLYINDFSDPKMKRMLEMIDLTVQSSDKEDFKYMVDLARSA